MKLHIKYLFFIIIALKAFDGYCQKDTTKKVASEQDFYQSAIKLIDSAKYKDAIVLLKKAVKTNPEFAAGYNKMAYAKLKLEDYKGAEKDLQQAVKLQPDNFESHKYQAIIYYKTKRYKEAKASLDSAISLNSTDDAEIYFYQAKLMFEGKANKPALDACAKAMDINPKYVDVIILKAEIRFAMKDYNYTVKELNEAFTYIKADKPNYDVYRLRARAYFELGDFKKSISDWSVFMEAFPDNEEALVLRGAAKIETGDNTGAIVDLDAAIKQNPKNPVSYNYRGVAKGEAKQFVEALKDFDYSIKLKFDYGAAYVNRAAVKFASKDKKGACDDLNKADSLGDEMAIKLIQTYCKQ